MTVTMRRVAITAAGVAIASAAIVTPSASAHPADQLDSACNSTDTLCVSAVHTGHDVKTITVHNATSTPGTMRVRWGDFHRSTSDTNRTWHIDDKQGRARNLTKPIRHSDLVCVTLESATAGLGSLIPGSSAPVPSGTRACVAV
jgi:hypothetical protein